MNDAPTLPNDFTAIREPHPGPLTGDQMSLLEYERLQELADTRAADRLWLAGVAREYRERLAPAVPVVSFDSANGGSDARPDDGTGAPGARGARGRSRQRRGAGGPPGMAEGQGGVRAPAPLSAARSAGRAVAAGTVTGLAALLWGARHALSAVPLAEGRGNTLDEVYLVTFALLAWQVLLCLLDRSRTAPDGTLPGGQVVITVPCYNEDPPILQHALLSMIRQTRLPDHVYVVDDGSDKADYRAVRRHFEAEAERRGVRVTWERTPNGGKRHAHAVAVRGTPGADTYVTVDSDGILDRRALAELLAAFADPRVQSSAGIVLAANNRAGLLARFTDLIYVTAQLTARSSLSVMGSVMVNSGVLAAYRAPVIRDNLDAYLNETFFGRRIEFSDDSMLTLFAFLRGKTVQQPGAFVFTAMPEGLSHHARQYLRWMRGSFIRSWWRFRYLPVRSYAYWLHLANWILTVVSLGAFANLYVDGAWDGRFRWDFLIVPAALGYGMSLRYLTVRRSDEPFRSQLLTWSLAPVAVLWMFTVMRAWRWYGAATWFRTGWGTRQDVEVSL